MEEYPTTMLELEGRFSTEEACRDYLAKLRWPEGFRCPRCAHDELMSLVRTFPALGGMPELHTYRCERCGHVETKEAVGTVRS